MTILNNAREKRNLGWSENFSRRSVILPMVVIVGLLVGFWLVSSFLVGVTRIEAGYTGIEARLDRSQHLLRRVRDRARDSDAFT